MSSKGFYSYSLRSYTFFPDMLSPSYEKIFHHYTHLKSEEFFELLSAKDIPLDSLFSSQSFLDTKDSLLNSLVTIYRSFMARDCLIKRHKCRLIHDKSNLPLDTSSRDFLSDGITTHDVPLNLKERSKLKKDILDIINSLDINNLVLHTNYEEHSASSHLSSPNSNQLNGSIFIPFSTPESERLISFVEDKIYSYMGVAYKTSASLCLHYHYSGDRDSKFHYDHAGMSTLKWFYFVFGTNDSDMGFRYIKHSAIPTHLRVRYLSRIGSLIPAKKERFTINSPFIHSKDLVHTYRENQICFADTSGFHSRSPARQGTLRITIQGGIDNNKIFSV